MNQYDKLRQRVGLINPTQLHRDRDEKTYDYKGRNYEPYDPEEEERKKREEEREAQRKEQEERYNQLMTRRKQDELKLEVTKSKVDAIKSIGQEQAETLQPPKPIDDLEFDTRYKSHTYREAAISKINRQFGDDLSKDIEQTVAYKRGLDMTDAQIQEQYIPIEDRPLDKLAEIEKKLKKGEEKGFYKVQEGFYQYEVMNVMSNEANKAMNGLPNRLDEVNRWIADHPELEMEEPEFEAILAPGLINNPTGIKSRSLQEADNLMGDSTKPIQGFKLKEGVGVPIDSAVRFMGSMAQLGLASAKDAAKDPATWATLALMMATSGASSALLASKGATASKFINVPLVNKTAQLAKNLSTMQQFKYGMNVGRARYMMDLEAGSAYNEYIQSGVHPEIAKQIAKTVGVANGIIEYVQFGQLTKALPGVGTFAKATQKIAQDELKTGLMAMGKAWGVDIAQNVGEEMLQESNTTLGLALSQYMMEAPNPNTVDGLKVLAKTMGTKEYQERMAETAVQTAMNVWLMPLASSAGSFAANRTITKLEQSAAKKAAYGWYTQEEMATKAYQDEAKKVLPYTVEILAKDAVESKSETSVSSLTAVVTILEEVEKRPDLSNEDKAIISDTKQKANEAIAKVEFDVKSENPDVPIEATNAMEVEQKILNGELPRINPELSDVRIEYRQKAKDKGIFNTIKNGLLEGKRKSEISAEVEKLLPRKERNAIEIMQYINAVEIVEQEIRTQLNAAKVANLMSVKDSLKNKAPEQPTTNETEVSQPTDSLNEENATTVNVEPEKGNDTVTPIPKEPLEVNEGKFAPTDAVKVPTKDIQLDPKRFQFRFNGTTNRMEGIAWNDKLAGTILLWESEYGDLYVVNGHHRVMAAKDNNVQTLDAKILRGITAEQARAEGAILNIAEGSADAIDTAKFLRDTNSTLEDLTKLGVPPKSKIARDGANLAKLEDGLFYMTATKQIPYERAVMIGRELGEDKVAQRQFYDMMVKEEAKRGYLKDSTIDAMLNQVKAVGAVEYFQESLLGADDTRSAVVERAELVGHVKDNLKNKKSVLKKITKTKNTRMLEQLGNKIKVDDNVKEMELADQALYLLDKTVNAKDSKVSQMFNDLAIEYAKTGDKKVLDKALKMVGDLMESGELLQEAFGKDKAKTEILDALEEQLDGQADLFGMAQIKEMPRIKVNVKQGTNEETQARLMPLIELMEKNPIFNGLEITFTGQESTRWMDRSELDAKGYRNYKPGYYTEYGWFRSISRADIDTRAKGDNAQWTDQGNSTRDQLRNNEYTPKASYTRGNISLTNSAQVDTLLHEAIHSIQDILERIDPEFSVLLKDWEEQVFELAKEQGINLPQGKEMLTHALMLGEFGYANDDFNLAKAVEVPTEIVEQFKAMLGKEFIKEAMGDNKADPVRAIKAEYKKLADVNLQNTEVAESIARARQRRLNKIKMDLKDKQPIRYYSPDTTTYAIAIPKDTEYEVSFFNEQGLLTKAVLDINKLAKKLSDMKMYYNPGEISYQLKQFNRDQIDDVVMGKAIDNPSEIVRAFENARVGNFTATDYDNYLKGKLNEADNKDLLKAIKQAAEKGLDKPNNEVTIHEYVNRFYPQPDLRRNEYLLREIDGKIEYYERQFSKANPYDPNGTIPERVLRTFNSAAKAIEGIRAIDNLDLDMEDYKELLFKQHFSYMPDYWDKLVREYEDFTTNYETYRHDYSTDFDGQIKFNISYQLKEAILNDEDSKLWSFPKHRGELTLQKIERYLREGSKNASYFRTVNELASAEVLKDRLFWHGTGGYIDGSLKAGFRIAEDRRGGGYGETQHTISISKSKKIASNFSGQSNSVSIYPVVIKENAKIIDMPEIQDALELEDILIDLWNDKVDAVAIGDWDKESGTEKELVIINPRIIAVGKPEHHQVYGIGGKIQEPTMEEIQAMYDEVKAKAVALAEKRQRKFEDKLEEEKAMPIDGRDVIYDPNINYQLKSAFDNGRENEVFYWNDKVEVIKNPTSDQYRQMHMEVLKQYPHLRGQDFPTTRTTYDNEGNSYIWKSMESVHGYIEPFINEKYGVTTNQNRNFQLKSAIDVEGFYSNLEKVLDEKMGSRGKAQDILNMLNKNGVKPEELEWFRIADFLADKDFVTKEEILEHMQERRIEFEKVDMEKSIFRQYTLHGGSGGSNYRMYAFRYANNPGATFTVEDHFDDMENPIADIMLTDRVSQLGGKVLFLEEFQSDWHQKGKAKGYYKPIKATEEQISKAKAEVLKAKELLNLTREPLNVIEEKQSDIWERRSKTAEQILTIREKYEPGQEDAFMVEVSPIWEEHQALIKQEADVNMERDKLFKEWVKANNNADVAINNLDKLMHPERYGDPDLVPDAPLKDSIVDFMFKSVIKEAVEGGYDRIAWATGEQVADKYSIRKVIDEAEVLVNPVSQTYEVYARKDGITRTHQSELTETQLVELLGKDLAAQIIEDAKPTFANFSDVDEILQLKTYTGLELETGGEFHKKLYNNYIPRMVKKYAKKWGIVPEVIEIGDTDPGEIGIEGIKSVLMGMDIDDLIPMIDNTYLSKMYEDMYQSAVDENDTENQAIIKKDIVDTIIDVRIDNGEAVKVENTQQLSIPVTPQMIEDVMSKGQPLFQIKELVAVHNITEGKLKSAVKIGGFPSPSIAITKQNISYESFGDISLLFSSDTINPRLNKANNVYASDVYSPRYPVVVFHPNKKTEAYKFIDSIGSKYGYVGSIDDSLEGGDKTALGNTLTMQLAYLEDTGKAIAPYEGRDYSGRYDYYKSQIDKDLPQQQEYIDWLDNKLIDMELSEYIKIPGVEIFTANGRKPFSKLHLPHTLDNVLRVMKKQELVTGEGGQYTGALRALGAKRFTSLKDIKANVSLLQSREVLGTFKDQSYLKQLEAEDIVSKYSEYSSNYEELAEILKRYYGIMSDSGRLTEMIASMKKAMKYQDAEMYGNVDDVDATNLATYAEWLRWLPTEYFEAKVQRAVGLEEIQAVIMPIDTDPELIQMLKDRGIHFIEFYDKSIDGDRQRAMDEVLGKNDVSFQIKPTSPWSAESIDEYYQLKDEPQMEERSWSQTVRDANLTSEWLRDLLTDRKMMYEVAHNEDSMIAGAKLIDERGIEYIEARLDNDFEATPDVMAAGMILIYYYQESGDRPSTHEMVAKVAKKATTAGQAIQILSYLNRESPEGILRFTRKEFDKQSTSRQRKMLDELTKKVEEEVKKVNSETVDTVDVEGLVKKVQDMTQEELDTLEIAQDDQKAQDFMEGKEVETNQKSTVDPEVIAQVIKDHYKGDGKRSLVSRLRNAGMNPTEAKLLSDSIEAEMLNATDAKVQEILDRLATGKAKAVDKSIKTLISQGRYGEALKLKLGQKKGVPVLTDEMADMVYQRAEEISKMPEGREKNVELALLLRDIDAEMPVGLAGKITTFRIMMMLLNAVTMLRNILGNLGFGVVDTFALNVVGSQIDKLYAKNSGFRTTLNRGTDVLRKQWQGYGIGGKVAYEDAKLGIDTNRDVSRMELGKTGRTFARGTVLGWLEEKLNIGLRVPDAAAMYATSFDTITEQMEIAGVAEPTQEMLDIAHNLGLYRTFNDDSLMSEAFKTIKNGLNIVGTKSIKYAQKKGYSDNAKWTTLFGADPTRGSFGFGDIILPFTKTVANITQRAIDYSPAGVVLTMTKLYLDHSQSDYVRQRMKVEAISRSITGTALIGTGMLLAQLGVIRGGDPEDEDKDVLELQEQAGLRPYTINLSAITRVLRNERNAGDLRPGDQLATYDWLQPSALTIAIGADIVSGNGETFNFINTIVRAMEVGSETVTGQPLLQNLTNVFEWGINRGLTNTLKSLPASFIPSVLGRVAQAADGGATDPYSYFSEGRQAWNLIANKLVGDLEINGVPLGRGAIPDRIDIMGNPIKWYGTDNDALKFTQALLSPAIMTDYKPTEEMQFLMDLTRKTQDTSIIQMPQKTFSKDGVSYEPTPEQFEAMSIYYGKALQQEINSLMKYGKGRDDEWLAKQVRDIVSDIKGEIKFKFIRGDFN